jgi:hypothetical protein
MTRADASERHAAAVHEAGHVIVARLLGLRVGSVRLGEEGKGGTEIECSAHLSAAGRIAVAEAGAIAVELLGASVWDTAAMSDAAKIIDLLEAFPELEREALRHEGHELARSLLAARLPLLADLAATLTRTGHIDEQELARFALARRS